MVKQAVKYMSMDQLVLQKKTMAYAKYMWILLDFIGLPTAVYGFILNMDNVKSSVIGLLAIIYLMCRIYFYVVEKKQAVRKKEFELWNLLMDKMDRLKKGGH